VAEGIESDVQARELERLGCTHAQGYLFSRPISAQAAEDIVAAHQPLGPKNVPLLDALAQAVDVGYYPSKSFEWPKELETRA
jgi:predicted signal transduction protein with EAL and GGDEF domain